MNVGLIDLLIRKFELWLHGHLVWILLLDLGEFNSNKNPSRIAEAQDQENKRGAEFLQRQHYNVRLR